MEKEARAALEAATRQARAGAAIPHAAAAAAEGLQAAPPPHAPPLRFGTDVAAGNTPSDSGGPAPPAPPSAASAGAIAAPSPWSEYAAPLFESAWSEPSGFTARAQILAASGNAGWGRPSASAAPAPAPAVPTGTTSGGGGGEERGDSDPEREVDVQFAPAIAELPPEVCCSE